MVSPTQVCGRIRPLDPMERTKPSNSQNLIVILTSGNTRKKRGLGAQRASRLFNTKTVAQARKTWPACNDQKGNTGVHLLTMRSLHGRASIHYATTTERVLNKYTVTLCSRTRLQSSVTTWRPGRHVSARCRLLRHNIGTNLKCATPHNARLTTNTLCYSHVARLRSRDYFIETPTSSNRISIS